jgi:hypothetical protein
MFAKNQEEMTLNSVSSFSSKTVILQAGTNTDYTCSYAGGHYSVLNITGSKSFMIKRGILKYGNGGLKYYFMIVNGTGGASLCLSSMKIEFVSAMNSTVFILGGKVSLDNVKINNQLDTNWVSPLVFSHSNTSSVIVDLHSCTITNSNYKNTNSSYGRSAVVYFINRTNATQPITFNMSFCLCLNNTFNLSNANTDIGGGCSLFCSFNKSSSMFFFFNKKKTNL